MGIFYVIRKYRHYYYSAFHVVFQGGEAFVDPALLRCHTTDFSLVEFVCNSEKIIMDLEVLIFFVIWI